MLLLLLLHISPLTVRAHSHSRLTSLINACQQSTLASRARCLAIKLFTPRTHPHVSERNACCYALDATKPTVPKALKESQNGVKLADILFSLLCVCLCVCVRVRP